jgi:hypothetical protein
MTDTPSTDDEPQILEFPIASYSDRSDIGVFADIEGLSLGEYEMMSLASEASHLARYRRGNDLVS